MSSANGNNAINKLFESKLNRYFGISIGDATMEQIYKASVLTVQDILLEKRRKFNRKMQDQNGKRVYYMCMEFLLGRSLKTGLYNLGITGDFTRMLKEHDIDIEQIYELEPDAGLGNGGLGRLAACFMDSLASLQYPALGYCICYEYGLFKQKIIDGWQIELPDNWLPGGESWLVQRLDKSVTVRFGGWVKDAYKDGKMIPEYGDYTEVEAIPYDLMVSGADSEAVSVLRLWRARNISNFDMRSFTQGDYTKAMMKDNEAELISKVLYPSDDHMEGKELRLKQQYFLVSASVQDMVSDHMRRYKDIKTLPDYAAIHINDTHPALAVPELMRILMDDFGLDWDESWSIVRRCFAYTNHTVLAEALEHWPEVMIQKMIPRIYQIIQEINNRFCNDMWNKYPGQWDKIQRMSIIAYNDIRMANLAVIASHSVNGVSSLHSEIIKDSVFKDYYETFPERFTNVTNGIAHRRWLCQSNAPLSALLDECIGTGYRKKSEQLIKFKSFMDDKSVLNRLGEIKKENKRSFSEFMLSSRGVEIDPDTRFDVQVKRLHEYKRQLLNVLKIISLYGELLDNPDKNVTPQTFIFGAKAAPSYYMAKNIIKLINFLSAEIAKNKKISDKLSVVFLEEYNVTAAEKLMPAAEISEQISLAGKEASGTSNMKFMINGAVTMGTLDGANVEIKECCGDNDIFIFGMDAEEVDALWKRGYASTYYYHNDNRLKRITDMLNTGFNGESFSNITQYLLTNTPIADPYMCLADFGSYMDAYYRMDDCYADKMQFNRMSLMNIATAGMFSADRAIEEYAENIWNLKKIK